MRVVPDMVLYDVADLSVVWVLADIYEMDLSTVAMGQPVDFSLDYLPGKNFQGVVSYIYPEVSETTRTVKVRVELNNPGFELKPGMFGEVRIKKTFHHKLVVPLSAVLSTGVKNIVFIKSGEGHFEQREVQGGIKNGEFYEILGGLNEGDEVVYEGNFLLDSEAKLKASVAGTEPTH